MSAHLTPLKYLFVSVAGGSWGGEAGDGEVDAKCIRGTDIDFPKLRVDSTRAPIRSYTSRELQLKGAVAGDLIIEKSGGGDRQPVGRVALWDRDFRVMPTNFAARLRVAAKTHPRFAAYLLASMWFDGRTGTAIKQTTGIQNLNLNALLSHQVSCPPLARQRSIADYLDKETGRIDAVMAAKRRLFGLLVERRQAAREELVSKARREGGRTRLGNVLKDKDERLGEDVPPELLSVSIHRGVIPFAEANPERKPRADELRAYKRCRTNDIVLNRMRAFQGGIGRASQDGIVSPDYAVLQPLSGSSSTYLAHLMQSPWFVGQMERILRGIGGVAQGNVRTPRVNWRELRKIEVPVPPISVQRTLADVLDAELAGSWQGQEMIEAQLNLLQEHREALITAAVTGQLDIPEAA